jgi:hypothetical protein
VTLPGFSASQALRHLWPTSEALQLPIQQPGKTGTGKQGPNLINQEVSEIMIYPKRLIFLTNNKNNNLHNWMIIAT